MRRLWTAGGVGGVLAGIRAGGPCLRRTLTLTPLTAFSALAREWHRGAGQVRALHGGSFKGGRVGKCTLTRSSAGEVWSPGPRATRPRVAKRSTVLRRACLVRRRLPGEGAAIRRSAGDSRSHGQGCWSVAVVRLRSTTELRLAVQRRGLIAGRDHRLESRAGWRRADRVSSASGGGLISGCAVLTQRLPVCGSTAPLPRRTPWRLVRRRWWVGRRPDVVRRPRRVGTAR